MTLPLPLLRPLLPCCIILILRDCLHPLWHMTLHHLMVVVWTHIIIIIIRMVLVGLLRRHRVGCCLAAVVAVAVVIVVRTRRCYRNGQVVHNNILPITSTHPPRGRIIIDSPIPTAVLPPRRPWGPTLACPTMPAEMVVPPLQIITTLILACRN